MVKNKKEYKVMTQENDYALPIILYDEKCVLCTRFKYAFQKIPGNKKISFVNLHEKRLYQIFSQLNYEQTQQEVHIIDKDGQILKGDQAISFVILLFPIAKKLTWLLESGMGKKALQFFRNASEYYREKLLKECNRCK
jgi:predicted DCC family thiol-disulfide oxidoreductase YuxK